MTKIVNINDAKLNIAKEATNEVLELSKERDLTGVLSFVFSAEDDGRTTIRDNLVCDGRLSLSDVLLAIKILEKEILDNFAES